MGRGVPFVLFAAVAGGLWSVLVSRAARDVNPYLGPVIAEGTGVLIGLMLIGNQLRHTTIEYSNRGLILLGFAGLCVFSADYFNLRAYALDVPVSVGAPIFMGGTIVIATLVGLVMGEGVSPRKLAGIAMVLVGVVLLAGMTE